MFTKIGNFLRLLDENGNLSLTNIAVGVVVAKIALSHECDIGSAAGLLTVLSGYHFKRFVNSKKQPALPQDQLAELKSEVSSLKLKVGLSDRYRQNS